MKIAREQNQQLVVGPVYLLAENDTCRASEIVLGLWNFQIHNVPASEVTLTEHSGGISHDHTLQYSPFKTAHDHRHRSAEPAGARLPHTVRSDRNRGGEGAT